MKIKSNALPQELDSPFYQANKKFCEVFERFIASKQGKVKGMYNAWSYVIFGKVEASYSWDLKYKRAVYSGAGSIWFSSKFQNLLALATWTCHDVKATNATFFVRRKKFIDIINPSFTQVEYHSDYVLKSDGERSPFFSKLLKILHPLFQSKEIYNIRLKNRELTIELRSEEHHFDIFNELNQLP